MKYGEDKSPATGKVVVVGESVKSFLKKGVDNSPATGENIVGGELDLNYGADESPATEKVVVVGELRKPSSSDVEYTLSRSAFEDEDESSEGGDNNTEGENDATGVTGKNIRGERKSYAILRLGDVGFKRARRFKSVSTTKKGYISFSCPIPTCKRMFTVIQKSYDVLPKCAGDKTKVSWNEQWSSSGVGKGVVYGARQHFFDAHESKFPISIYPKVSSLKYKLASLPPPEAFAKLLVEKKKEARKDMVAESKSLKKTAEDLKKQLAAMTKSILQSEKKIKESTVARERISKKRKAESSLKKSSKTATGKKSRTDLVDTDSSDDDLSTPEKATLKERKEMDVVEVDTVSWLLRMGENIYISI